MDAQSACFRAHIRHYTEGGRWRMFHSLHGVSFLKHLPSLMHLHLHLHGGAISEKREKKKSVGPPRLRNGRGSDLIGILPDI